MSSEQSPNKLKHFYRLSLIGFLVGGYLGLRHSQPYSYLVDFPYGPQGPHITFYKGDEQGNIAVKVPQVDQWPDTVANAAADQHFIAPDLQSRINCSASMATGFPNPDLSTGLLLTPECNTNHFVFPAKHISTLEVLLGAFTIFFGGDIIARSAIEILNRVAPYRHFPKRPKPMSVKRLRKLR